MAGIEALLRGRVLNDRYRVEEVIGRGGMGAVYRATDERLGRPVAVKVITAAAGGDEAVRERIRARFRHEAASAARLPHHPNVVPVYDYGTDEALGLDFIVMELLPGEDLASRLAKAGPPPLALALRILRDAAKGIAVGHRAGLIHRDVKPGNVFLVEDEHDPAGLQVRVLDFGIAKAMADEDTQTALTQDGRAPLSPAYASPEQLRGEARLNPASDVFSLGALAFQLLTGEKPFTEADRNRLSIGMEVPLPSVRARNPAVPEAVEAIVRRTLAFDPAQRFASGAAMAEALDAVLRALEGSPAAGAVPAVAGPVVTSDADDDRTALAGDDRTLLAPSGGPAAPPPRPAAAPAPAPAPAAAAPVIPRRRVEPERRGPSPVLWVVLLLVLAGAGFVAWRSMAANGEGEGPPLANLPDSAATDSIPRGDTLTAEDAPRLEREALGLIRQGQNARAAELLRQAVELDPDQVRYRDGLAFALIRMRRYDEAATLLEEAIRMDRTYDLSYSHLAEARLALGDTAGAVQALERFLDVSLSATDRERARTLLQELTAPKPVIPTPPQVIGIDSTGAAPPDTAAGAPRDTIRLRR